MVLDQLVQRVRNRTEGRYIPLAPGLNLFRCEEPYGFEATVYEPLACLILQGQKETRIGSTTHVVSAGQSIVVSHPLPVVSRVTEASPQTPYLALIAPIDLGLLRSLDHELEAHTAETSASSSFVVHAVDERTLAVLDRYVALADDASDARVLGPGLRRELHYRLLRASSGGMLRSLLRRSSHASNIAQAIQQLRAGFRAPMEVDTIAQSVGMSSSSFYKHFKTVTSTTPLQYQKDLRLTEAQRLLQAGDHTVSTAAFTVGYESPSQFSREYSRKFGTPPSSALASS